MDGQHGHSEFEHFLQQNADAHRLYPSERVWTRIYSRLHGRRRRTILLLLLIPLLSATGWYLTSTSTTSTRSTTSVADLTSTAHSRPTLERIINPPQIEKQPTNQDPVRTTEILVPVVETPISRSATAPNDPVIKDDSKLSSPSTLLALSTQPSTTTPSTDLVVAARQEAQTGTLKEDQLAPAIENVVNSYQRQLHQPRFRWQVHFTPTVSYRSLHEDQKFIAQARMNSATAATANTNSTDLSSVISHRPDLGMQLGFTGTYPISKKIDWVTGIQFNVSKYDIAAYNYPSEVATIALMNPWGGTSTVSTLTSFRSNGFRSAANWLRNYYYSVSLPLGLQWRVIGKKQTHWGISATVQPTYVVGNRSYVISVDYQNYAEVPYLINKWNLNVGLETYARFQLGKNDFQIGPQIRYQALSSFKKGYPVQEHLYDFGIKLGMILGK